jgi:hypothetical protein
VQYSVECCTNFKLDVRIGVVFVSLSILISKHALLTSVSPPIPIITQISILIPILL